jgi:hypothetical protein
VDLDNLELRQTLDLLRGNLSQNLSERRIRVKGVDLTSLFSTLVREQGSGTLTAKDSKTRRFLYVAPDEMLLLTEGERESRSVETRLVEQGMVSEKALERARERSLQLRMDLAYVLEKQGIVSYNDVEKFRKRKAFEDIEDLFLWPDVSIEFQPNTLPAILEDPKKDVLGLRMNVWEMLETVIDRIQEWHRIRKTLVSEDLVLGTVESEGSRGRVLHPLGEKIPKAVPVQD